MNPADRRRHDAARILVVDDEITNVLLARGILGQAGYTDITALTNPREALDLYREDPFDLVLLDLEMDEIDGFQMMDAMEACHDDQSYLPVLVITGNADREIRLRALKSGAKDFLTKPFDPVEMISRVEIMLHIRMLNKDLDARVRERTRELENTRLEIIRRLGRAAEFRDNETGLHIIRMSLFAQIIARHAGADEATCQLILNASPMHDIGKIGVPDAILLKPGRLTPDEYKVIQTHCTIGDQILDGDESELIGTARDIARCHHEKWDGSGYPSGLAGEDIPWMARVTAIADVFDALTSSRPYKKAWTLEDAVALINSEAGKHFDPDLVACFNAGLGEIDAVRLRLAEPPHIGEDAGPEAAR